MKRTPEERATLRRQLHHALRELTLENGDVAWCTANEIAFRARLQGDRRSGHGAVKGSWSGYTAPAFAAAPVLRAMVKRGEIRSMRGFPRHGGTRPDHRTPDVYALTYEDAAVVLGAACED